MKDYIKVATLDNQIEGQIVEDILNERNIPHFIRTFHDSAYEGLFQITKGWGAIYAPIEFKNTISEIVVDIRKGE